jgi:hypothetical protein
MTGLDYIGPISPVLIMGSRYILIAVDYATRYPIAGAMALYWRSQIHH